MLAIKFAFPANRYHATPWGRHVNEGAVEWPPSPWRITRAVISAWRRSLPDLSAERIEPVIAALVAEPPVYRLPPVAPTHTRHYMPFHEGRNERTTLVLDAFLSIAPGESVYAIWPNAALDRRQRDDLQDILGNMLYLGRSESWVEAALTDQSPKPNCYPAESDVLPGGDWEVERTLVPRSDAGISDLTVATSELHRRRRIDPEGAYWRIYIRPAYDAAPAFTASGSRATDAGSQVVRFALGGSVLPPVADTLRWAELARKAALAQYGRRNDGKASRNLSGKDGAGNPLTDNHRHAFYWPTDENGDGRLDHLTIWTPAGLDAAEVDAVTSIRQLVHKDGAQPVIQLSYQGRGSALDFAGVSPLFGQSRQWRSLTPYVPPWRVRLRGRKSAQPRIVNGPAEQMRKEAVLRWPGCDGPVAVDDTDPMQAIAPMRSGRSSGIRPVEFRRYRDGGVMGGPPSNLKVEYAQPVNGPIALGFGCHYGLGLFVPA